MKLTRMQPEPAVMRCRACGWAGVPRARRLSRLLGPVYLLLALVAILVDTFGYPVLETLSQTPVLVVAILIGLPGIPFFLQRIERCDECTSQDLDSGSSTDEPARTD